MLSSKNWVKKTQISISCTTSVKILKPGTVTTLVQECFSDGKVSEF